MEEELELGTAGASARREGERRRLNREERTRAKHRRIGGALLALREAPAHERVWNTGAVGEEATAAYLAKHCPHALVLHDRRVPGRRTNIDHIAVAASGVFVIDSKHYKGKKVRVANPLLGPAKLLVNGSDKTKLVDGLASQVDVVTGLVDVPVHGVLCFIDADLPLLGTPTIKGHPILNRRGLAKRINREGPLSAEQVTALARRLSAALLPA